MADQPGTIRDLFMAMPDYANEAAIQNVNKTIQFDVTGDEPGHYYIEVQNGSVTVHEGTAASPNATITTPADVWVKIATGQKNGAVAFMQGEFKASGDLSLLMQMQSWFDTPGG